MLVKNPGFTAIAVLTLALGIGANTALFSVVNGVLLNPLPYPHPEQLIKIYGKTAQFSQSSVAYLNFLDWQKDNRTFAAMAAYRNDDFNLTGQGEAERLRGDMISADFFGLLDVRPVMGRTFQPQEDQAGAAPVVLIGAGLWKRKFGGSLGVLGNTMTLNGTSYTIIGVVPSDFHFHVHVRDVYVPIGQWNDPYRAVEAGRHPGAGARRYGFGDADPIGQRLNTDLIVGKPQIIGVVGHIKHWGLDSKGKEQVEPQFYIPFMQLPDQFMPLVSHGAGLVVRTHGDPTALGNSIRQAIQSSNKEQVMHSVRTLETIVSDSLAARRFSIVLLGLFATLSLVLSSVGIYGVISYLVGQRVQEIGIRMALGAQQSDVLRLIVGEGAKLALIGVAIGLGAALLLTRLMTKMIYGVSAHDPLTFAGVAIVLVAVALAACYVPARRAMRLDPMIALRYE